jgi:hypothetical protein
MIFFFLVGRGSCDDQQSINYPEFFVQFFDLPELLWKAEEKATFKVH